MHRKTTGILSNGLVAKWTGCLARRFILTLFQAIYACNLFLATTSDRINITNICNISTLF